MRSGAASPRSTPSATGKNARYDAMTATDSHCGQGVPPRSIWLPIALTTGAKAMSGTIWLTHDPGQQAPLDETPALHDEAEHRADRRRR